MSPARSQRQGALAQLRSTGASPEAVDQLLRDHSIPLVEGSTCTFLWRGEADWVGIEHRIMGVPIPLPLHRLKGTDLWYATSSYRVARASSTESCCAEATPRRA